MPAAAARIAPALPPPDDWRTTDQDEINRRRLRARAETPRIVNRDERHPIFSNFDVHSPSGVTYSVEVRDLSRRQFSCGCVDFGVNGLGTCKHVEAVLDHLENTRPADFAAAIEQGSPRIDLVPDPGARTLRVERGLERLPRTLRKLFDANGLLASGFLPEMELDLWAQSPQPELRVSQDVAPWLEGKRRALEAVALRRTYEQNVQSGLWPAQETLLPLFPYQREGMLHLVCAERALLADEMGLGKTAQAVAASVLLRRLKRAERVLIVTPASLRGEWEEQIARLTALPSQAINGARAERLAAYARDRAPFFTIASYEQMAADALEVNARLRPEVVILDEAQRIKNWSTKTALAVKRLRSRYAWVLTGAPIENRIDELYSLVSFLDPSIFGPLFRFNRDFYDFDERGRPRGQRNLDKLRERIRPVLLRRRKADVEAELPNRVDRTFLVPLGDSQRAAYETHEAVVRKLLAANRRSPLDAMQRDRLMRELNMMRMICDTNYILGQGDRACPKLDELARILSECMANPQVKVVIFSEWERMLELVAGLCQRLKIGFALHTGSVAIPQRRVEIQRFRAEADCRVFLSTDTGGAGVDLRNASVVIHCDVPWNPGRTEQRIARAWRPEQHHAVTVLYLVSEWTIEQRILGAMAGRKEHADGWFDDGAEAKANPLARVERLMMGGRNGAAATPAAAPPRQGRGEPRAPARGPEAAFALRAPAAGPRDDRPRAFAHRAAEVLGPALVACEERFPSRGDRSVLLVVVERDAAICREQLRALESEFLEAINGAAPEVTLEVMDRATAELLRRLAESGIVAPSLRASRVLFPAPDEPRVAVLTRAERDRSQRARDSHARRLNVARVLAAEGMTEEAREALVAAIHEFGRALAAEHRVAEPANALGAIAPPLDSFWPTGDGLLDAVRAFLSDETAPIPPMIEVLGRPVESSARQAREFFAGIKAKLANIGE